MELFLPVIDELKNCNSATTQMGNILHAFEMKMESNDKALREKYINTLHFSIQFTCRDTFQKLFTTYVAELIINWSNVENLNIISNTKSLEQQLQTIKYLRFHELFKPCITKAIYTVIDSFISKLKHSDYTEPYLPAIKEWFDINLLPFIHSLHSSSPNSSNQDDKSKLLSNETSDYRLYLLQSLCYVRTAEMFEIVAEYPESLPAIKELKSSASYGIQTENQTYIGKKFKQTLIKRLLHPDPSDLLLNFIAAPVRAYLKGRKDTVQCVVSSLGQGRESDLHVELKRGESLAYGQDKDYEEPVCQENWEPRKRNPELSDDGFSGLDILALLVSIYGSTDVFVNEYRVQLAEKLLFKNIDYMLDADLITLEHLKKRFGEESLHNCEIVLHDIEESKRTNNAISSFLQQNQQKPSLNVPTDFAVISDNYWPKLNQFKSVYKPLLRTSVASATTSVSSSLVYTDPEFDEDNFKPHPVALQIVKEYAAVYSDLKRPRALNVYSAIGQVQLSLEFDNGVNKTFSVSPIQATLILHVADNARISLKQLVALTNLSENEIRHKMLFWVSKRVVVESYGKINESSPSSVAIEIMYESVENWLPQTDEDDEIVVESGDQDYMMSLGGRGESTERGAEFFSTIESYVVGAINPVVLRIIFRHLVLHLSCAGILSNQGSVSLERMHTMLKLMTADTGSSRDIKFDLNYIELQSFLQHLVSQEKLNLIDSLYSNHKK